MTDRPFLRRVLPACLVLVLALGACATPSVPLLGATRSVVTVDGVAFTVHHDRTRAEAVRTTALPDPGLRRMLLMSRTAMEAASGCPIRPGTLYGDRVVAEAFLDCPDSPGVTLRPAWVFTPPR